MSEATDEPRAEQGDPQSTPGELLRSAREQRRLTVHQAAEELHVDPAMIEAIEANRFAALGAPVYARGHLRRYATVLGLAPEPLLECYARLSDTPAMPIQVPVTMSAPVRNERIPVGALTKPLVAVVLAAVAAGAGWWIFDRESPAPEASPRPGAAVEQAPDASEPPIPASDSASETGPDAPDTVSATSKDPQEAAVLPAPQAEASRAAVAPAPAAGQIRLRLQFSDASWAEVYDGAGNRLMFGLGSAGRVHTVTGPAPLHVTLGAVSAVSAEVNGEKIVIPRRAGRNASKFAIDAAGAVTPESG